MPTVEEVRAQLTGPGGPFEVITDDVDGIEMKVFKNRFPDLRVVAQFGLAHGDKEFIVYGDRRITFDDFVADRELGQPRPRRRRRRRQG